MREAGAGWRRTGRKREIGIIHPLKHSKNRVKAVSVSVSLPDFISLLLYRMLVVMFQAVSLPAALLCSAFVRLTLLSPAGNPRRREGVANANETTPTQTSFIETDYRILQRRLYLN